MILDIKNNHGVTTVKVDREDLVRVSCYTWYVDFTAKGQPYVTSSYQGRKFRLHRLVMRAKPGQIVDHINGDTTDNRKANLRIVTAQQNSINRVSAGVHKVKRTGKWTAQIYVGEHKIHLGTYKTKAQAKAARQEAMREWYGPYARGAK